jgi:hypothetical protein
MAKVQPPAYVHLLNNDIIPDMINETNFIAQILHWIGFCTEAQHELPMNDVFDSFNDISMLPTKDISKMADSFGNWTTTNGCMIFGTKRTKRLTTVNHWTQDFYHISEQPTITRLNKNIFKHSWILLYLELELGRH